MSQRADEKIVIVGYYGFDNAGDELILKSMTASLKKQNQNAKILVLSNNALKTESEHAVESVNRWSPVAIVRAICSCQLLVFGGGGLLQDVTGTLSLWYYLVLLWIAILLRKNIIVYAVGVGPVRHAVNKSFISLALNRATRISVRDEESSRELKNMLVTKQIEVAADPVLALNLDALILIGSKGAAATTGHSFETEREGKSRRLKIGFVVRPIISQPALKKVLAIAAYQAAKEMRGEIFILPFHPALDQKAAEELSMELEGRANILRWRNLDELIYSLSKMNLVVSMRYHALILAVLMKIPVVGIAADPKICNFLKEFSDAKSLESNGGSNLVSLEQCLQGKLFAAMIECWNRREEFLKLVEGKIPSLRSRATDLRISNGYNLETLDLRRFQGARREQP